MLCLFINIMHQLTKAKSQQTLDRLFNNSTRQNYYDHHNMPVRTSSKNFYKTHNNSPKKHFKSQEKINIIGRQLYPQIPKKVKDPGPGTYDWNYSQPKSFKFANHSSINRKIIPVRSRQQRIGPGFYKYQKVTQSNMLSKYKKSLITIMNKNSPQKQQRLVYKINETPGPGKYDNYTALNKISNHPQVNSHKISITSRSSIIRNDKLPGPGYYRWDEYYSKNKDKKKPCIQYKFVYGHPS